MRSGFPEGTQNGRINPPSSDICSWDERPEGAPVDKWITFVVMPEGFRVSWGKSILMKAIVTLTMAVVASVPVLSQTEKTHSFHAVIDSVLRDFPNNLRNITGDLVLAQGEFENYASTVELPGAESCIITRWHSTEDTTAAWQARMYKGQDFTEASRLYRESFRRLNGCYLKLVDGSKFFLAGDWEPAKEEAPFTTSTFRVQTGDERYQEVKVEVELVFLVTDWAVNVNIVSKKRDDRVGGDAEVSR